MPADEPSTRVILVYIFSDVSRAGPVDLFQPGADTRVGSSALEGLYKIPLLAHIEVLEGRS